MLKDEEETFVFSFFALKFLHEKYKVKVKKPHSFMLKINLYMKVKVILSGMSTVKILRINTETTDERVGGARLSVDDEEKNFALNCFQLLLSFLFHLCYFYGITRLK